MVIRFNNSKLNLTSENVRAINEYKLCPYQFFWELCMGNYVLPLRLTHLSMH